MLPLAPSVPSTTVEAEEDSRLVRLWLLEIWLVWVRWGVGALAVVSALALHPNTWLAIVPTGLALGIANGWVMRVLERAPRLRVRWLAAGLDGAIALSAIGLSSRTHLHALLPASLLPLILVMAFRFGAVGLLGTVSTLTVIVAGVAEEHVGFGVISADETIGVFGGWEMLLLAQGVLSFALLRALRDWSKWQDERVSNREATMRRLESGLSQREWELLPWLAHPELTYEDIADKLHMSPETVKTHVRRASGKLGIQGQGRWLVVTEARQRGFLPGEPDLLAHSNSDHHTGAQS